MHERFQERLEKALRQMQSSVENGRLKDESVANRQLGRLEELAKIKSGDVV